MRDEWHVEDILMQLPKDVQGIGEEVLHAISCSRQLFCPCLTKHSNDKNTVQRYSMIRVGISIERQ